MGFNDVRVRWAVSAVAVLVLAAYAVWMMRTPEPSSQEAREERPSPVPAALREKIDRWIVERKLNRYGDPPGTAYAGGTPLFDPKSGTSKDRYVYILDKHPELRKGD